MKKIILSAPEKKIGAIELNLPASKSISNRVLIIKALCRHYFNTDFKINNLALSDDTKVLQNALKNKESETIDVGAAGTSMRFLTAYYAGMEGREVILTGSERMKQRPIGVLVDALKDLGADINYLGETGFPPLHIKGKKLKGGQLKIAGNISSQFISALLLIAPVLENGLRLEIEEGLVSKPYISMTLSILKYFGLQSKWKENTIKVPPQNIWPKDIGIESDWSAASYIYAMMALFGRLGRGKVFLSGLYENSFQGDRILARLMEDFGVKSRFTDKGVFIRKVGEVKIKSFEYNFIQSPDLAQTFIVLCAALNIPATFRGLQTLSIKETDRSLALQKELQKIKTIFFEKEKGIWQVQARSVMNISNEPIPEFETYEDHRMAMSLPLLTYPLRKIIIQDPEVVSKSFPAYWSVLKSLGFGVVS